MLSLIKDYNIKFLAQHSTLIPRVIDAKTFNILNEGEDYYKWVNPAPDGNYGFAFPGPGLYDERSKFKAATCTGGGFHFASKSDILSWRNAICGDNPNCELWRITIPITEGNRVVKGVDKSKVAQIRLEEIVDPKTFMPISAKQNE